MKSDTANTKITNHKKVALKGFMYARSVPGMARRGMSCMGLKGP